MARKDYESTPEGAAVLVVFKPENKGLAVAGEFPWLPIVAERHCKSRLTRIAWYVAGIPSTLLQPNWFVADMAQIACPA